MAEITLSNRPICYRTFRRRRLRQDDRDEECVFSAPLNLMWQVLREERGESFDYNCYYVASAGGKSGPRKKLWDDLDPAKKKLGEQLGPVRNLENNWAPQETWERESGICRLLHTEFLETKFGIQFF